MAKLASMDNNPHNVLAQRDRREYEPFMLNGDAHHSGREIELRMGRCLFGCQKQRKDSRTGGSRHLPRRLPHQSVGQWGKSRHSLRRGCTRAGITSSARIAGSRSSIRRGWSRSIVSVTGGAGTACAIRRLRAAIRGASSGWMKEANSTRSSTTRKTGRGR